MLNQFFIWIWRGRYKLIFEIIKNSLIKILQEMDSNGKIVLNRKSDLLKLNINTINNTKIYNYTGEYFEQLYKEAIAKESIKVKEISISYIIFEIIFTTEVFKE